MSGKRTREMMSMRLERDGNLAIHEQHPRSAVGQQGGSVSSESAERHSALRLVRRLYRKYQFSDVDKIK